MTREVGMRMVRNEPYDTVKPHKERGVIINVASTVGIEGENRQSLYAATKGAIIGMTMPLARDFGKFSVRVVTIAPGPFKTPMTDSGQENDMLMLLHAKQGAIERIGDSNEFADVCNAVINSTYMTGTVIRLDGGIRLPKL